MKRLLPLLLVSPSVMAHIDDTLAPIEVFDHSEDQTLVDFIPSVTTLRGRELQKRRESSIGETLQTEAGISSSSFGPAGGRPMIRGLDGDRIRILQNSLGTLDASTQSLDHAIPVDTLTVEQIEVVRGPMSLLYGSSAVGGVINLVTNRIHSEYEEGFFSQSMFQGESATNSLQSALHLNYGVKNWMFHVDGSTRNLNDYQLPQHVKAGAREQKGDLLNSRNQQDNVAIGVSHIFSKGYFGLSYNHFHSVYGTVAAPDMAIDMTQNRFELHAEYRPDISWIQKFKFRSAQSDYFHKEIGNHDHGDHGSGHGHHHGEHQGSIFSNKGNESRFEMVTKSKNTEGVIGLQTQLHKFKVTGDEAFVPTTDNQKLALFSFHQYNFTNKNALSFGARVEGSKIDKESDPHFGDASKREFVGVSGSLGYKFKLNEKSSLSASFSYTERAPNFQELYADGEHLATGTYEEGDSSLKKEKAKALEVSYKVQEKKWEINTSVYSQFFDHYINHAPNGEIHDDLPVYSYEQVSAVVYGVDLDSRFEVAEIGTGVLYGIGRFDYVRGKDTDNGENLARMSPARFLAGLEYKQDKWAFDLEAQHVTHQSKVSEFESTTKSYTLTNLGYTYSFVKETYAVNLFARVKNIFDVEARNHVSLLSRIAPMPGRNFIVGAQFQF
ncbi:MAG TPA: TonB-dependent receptor [Bacteriovoracaceae bacterium]|nr:TonB-dependent receptor [Bacteriovoracaceae bacterium]